MPFWIIFQSLLPCYGSCICHQLRATKIDDGLISASLLSNTHTLTHCSACSDIAPSYTGNKHHIATYLCQHTTTVPQFCIREIPYCYNSEWWNYHTATVLCEKTTTPAVSWDRTTTLLQNFVQELPHSHISLWRNNNTTVLLDRTTTLLYFCG